jgi:hypothetical protein
MTTQTTEQAGLPEPAATIFDDGYWLQNKNGPLANLPRYASRKSDVFTAEQVTAAIEADRAKRAEPVALTDEQIMDEAYGEGHYLGNGCYSFNEREVIKFARALLASAQQVAEKEAVPDGFVLVPKKPTIKMLDAGSMNIMANQIAGSCYRAMLAAAPSASEPTEQKG